MFENSTHTRLWWQVHDGVIPYPVDSIRGSEGW